MKIASDLIAEFLEKKEIKVAFGIIGSANSYIYDSIAKRGYTKIVNVHHEQTAVLAAGAYYRASGKMAVALATAGPGVANTITGIISCWADSNPVLIISGQESTRYVSKHKNLRMIGTQGFDIAKMVSDVTKYSDTVLSASEVQDKLESSFRETKNGRYGPSLLAIPFDMQSCEVEEREWSEESTLEDEIDNQHVDYVLNCLNNAKRPVILGGNGIKLSGSKDNFVKLVNKLKVPTLLSWAGIDILPDNNENFYGKAGIYGQRSSNFVIQNSDLLLVLGSRLAIPQVGYDFNDFAPGAKIIVVDIDAEEAKKYEEHCDRLIIGDCGQLIDKLLNRIDEISPSINEWKRKCDEWKEKYPVVMEEHLDAGFLNSYRFMDKISDYLKDDQIIVTDMGTALLSGHQAIKLKEGQSMFTSTGLGEMGYGLPAAIGAAFAAEGKEVLCLNCDGGMMMNLQEMQTIKHYNLPVKIIIFNNDGYLMIKHTQKMLFKGKYVSTNKDTGLTLPDYQKVSRAFGFKTNSIYNWEEFDESISQFLNANGPAVCEVFMDPEQAFIPKVKGVKKEDGTIVPPPLEEMSPLLPLEQVKNEMIIGLNKKSLIIER